MNDIEEYISSNKPVKIVIREAEKDAIIFLSESEKLRLKLDDQVSAFLGSIRLSSFVFKEYKFGTIDNSIIEFVFNWEEKKLTPYEKIMRKINILFRDHSATEMTVSTSFQNKVETDVGIFDCLLTREELIHLYNETSSLNGRVTGDAKNISVSFGDQEYLLSQYKINNEITVKIKRMFREFERLRISLSMEFKNRLKSLDNGIIVTSYHDVIKMEHIVPALIDIDSNAASFTCTVGENLVSTGLPVIDPKKTSTEELKSLHYKYFIFGNVTSDKTILQRCLDLVYAGKTVIIGFDSTSIYGCFMSYLSLVGDNSIEVSRHLSSCVGFYYPNLSMVDGELSLENSEFTALSDHRIKDIAAGEFSKSTFMKFTEKSSKSFQLISSVNDSTQKEEFESMLVKAVELGATDIHLVVGSEPKFRIENNINYNYSKNVITVPMINQISSFLLEDDKNKYELESSGGTFRSYPIPGVGRFRVQLTRQRGSLHIAIRHTPFSIPSASEMNIPPILIEKLKTFRRGLIVTSGKPRSGKSTTNNIFLDTLKNEFAMVILSIADPIEYIHSHGKGIFSQVEVPTDAPTFEAGLYSSFRMDTDVVEISEARDRPTVQSVFRLTNSGTLTITSTHSESIVATLTYLIDKADENDKGDALDTLANRSAMFINQRLMPGIRRKYVCAFEYLIPTPSIRNLILKDKMSELASKMKTDSLGSKENCAWGDYEVIELYLRGEITKETMEQQVTDKDSLAMDIQAVRNARRL